MDPDAFVATKGARTISLCIPCRNEAATVAGIVEAARRELVERHAVLDELIVLDDASTDATAVVAAEAGATVVAIDDVHAVHGPATGKGNALWASLVVSSGDVVVWCDGDVTSFRPDWVMRLAAPLLADDCLGLVKANYRRPTEAGGGGRTTELVARPLLALLAPDLAWLAQPLAGEFAGRRSVLEQVPFSTGWGVELGMYLDVVARFGLASVAQVDLGVRRHRHQTLDALSVQAAEVMATALARLVPGALDLRRELVRADGSTVVLNLGERPPLASRA